MAKKVKRAFKYRFYPTDEQAAELSRTFGCVRFVYNWGLALRSNVNNQYGQAITYADTDRLLTCLKRDGEHGWLSEVSAVPLQQALRHLQGAFANFFAKRAKYPTFKSRKRSRASATYTRPAIRWRNGALTLAKMTDPLNIAWSRRLPEGAEPSSVTVSRDAAGRWHVSILVEEKIVPLPPVAAQVGIDAGITNLVTLSTGEKITNPRHERADHERLARAQKALARKQRGSANREKAKARVARAYARIADRRRDHLHKLTTRLVRENQTVVIEDLTVCNMVRNHSLARAISDAAWRQLRSMLQYKADWYGRELVVIDRWYPSSKLCSACGTLQQPLPLHIRDWVCACGATHDRDVNAAVNILAAGLADSNACGADIGPQGRTPGGRSATKQENPVATPGIPLLQEGEEVNVLPGGARVV